ncbi:MAG: tetraacyldisaccharide 4'-kinase [Pseudomonadota bacterium]
MREALQRAWLRRGALARLLWPISLLFGALAAVRRGLYRAGVLRSAQLPVPVIVVGNVVAGGAGKTPVVIALLAHLKSQGLRAGLVSRGYGRSGGDCREVPADGDPRSVGDEPLLAKQRTGVPVFVAPRRAQAARALLRAYPETQVIVSDDGLQHYALARDVEICVFDERGVGNGWLLPAGPLREPWPRPVDLTLRPQQATGIPGFTVRRTLADHAVRADGTRVELAALRGQPLGAIAGIARPEAFFAMLRERGLSLGSCTALPDHAEFAASDVADAGPLVCTEKDAVKLWRLRPEAWAVPLQLDIEPAFWAALDRLLHAKLSSRHGSETA